MNDMPQEQYDSPVTLRSSPLVLTSVLVFSTAVAFMAVCHPLFRGCVYGGPDLSQQDYPARAFYAAGLRKGELRQWSPHLFRGFSLHGEGQTGMYHPLHLMCYRLLPLPAALFIDTVWAFPLGFIGMFLLLRRWGVSTPGRIVGSSLFCFSTFFHAHAGHLALLAVHAHFPFFLLFAELASRKTGEWELPLIGLAVTTCSAVLLGHPPQLWIILLGTGIYALIRNWGRDPHRLQILLTLAGGVALGLCLGGLQLLPTFALTAQSSRSSIDSLMRLNFSLHPANLFQIAAPYLFRGLAVGNWLYPSATDSPVFVRNISEFSIYPGICAIILCLFRFCRRRICVENSDVIPVKPVAILALVGFLLMLGRFGILFLLLDIVPVIREFRCSARYVSYIHFAIAVFAASGFDRFCRVGKSSMPRWLWGIPCLAVLLTGIAWLLLPLISTEHFPVNFGWQLLAGPILAASSCALLTRRYFPGACTVVLGVLLVLDVSLFGMNILIPVDKLPWRAVERLADAYTRPPEINKEYRLEAPANSGIWDGFCLTGGYCGIPPKEPLDEYVPTDIRRRLSSAARAWTESGWQDIPDALPRFRLIGEIAYDISSQRRAVLQKALVSDMDYPLPSGITPGPGRVIVARDLPQDILVKTACETPMMLVCSDRYDSDWHATVNGEEVDILPLYGWSMRGIAVPGGNADVRMFYQSESMRLGTRISGFAFIVLLVIAGRSARRLRRPRARCQPGEEELSQPEVSAS